MRQSAVMKLKEVPLSTEFMKNIKNTKRENLTKKRSNILSIIIVSYNTEKILEEALRRVYDQKYFNDLSSLNFEVIVVDNDSKDNSCAMVEREFPQVKLIRNSYNAGFAAANNQAIKEAKGDYILLLNSDAYIFEDTLKESVIFMDNHPNCGIMGVQLVCEDGSAQPSVRDLPSPFQKFKVMSGLEARFSAYKTYYDMYSAGHNQPAEAQEAGWVPGAYFLIRREVIDMIGPLDERYFMYFEEVDFCKRAHEAGWQVMFNPNIMVIHLGGQSSLTTKKQISRNGKQLVSFRVQSEYYYYRKNHGFWAMLFAAGIELGWKSLICLKNKLVKSKYSRSKFEEAAQSIRIVWQKLIQEHFLINKLYQFENIF